MTQPAEPLADTVPATAARLGIGITQLYKELRAGRLVARKLGRRTLIERAEQAKWLASLPTMSVAA